MPDTSPAPDDTKFDPDKFRLRRFVEHQRNVALGQKRSQMA